MRARSHQSVSGGLARHYAAAAHAWRSGAAGAQQLQHCSRRGLLCCCVECGVELMRSEQVARVDTQRRTMERAVVSQSLAFRNCPHDLMCCATRLALTTLLQRSSSMAMLSGCHTSARAANECEEEAELYLHTQECREPAGELSELRNAHASWVSAAGSLPAWVCAARLCHTRKQC